MGVSRKQALKQIRGVSGQIELHLSKMEADPSAESARHWRGEVEEWIVQVLEAAEVVGKRTEEQVRQQASVWRRKLEQLNARDHG